MASYLADFRVGDTLRIRLLYPAGTDITDTQHTLTLKANFEDDDAHAVLQVTAVAGSDPEDDPANGLAFIEVSATLTAAIPPARYYYDIQAKHSSGDIKTLCPPVSDYKARVRAAPQVTERS